MEDDASLGPGQLPVPVHQLGVLLVEDAAVAVGPQGVDVVPGGGFEAMVERGDQTPGGSHTGRVASRSSQPRPTRRSNTTATTGTSLWSGAGQAT